jgi:bifunctional UDP-N-acetylglucosamine pyrophosphorylase/glucosamine-1-phosphate N-acetyltransferase
LSAGKGTRLNCIDKPKVMLEIGGQPIISYVVNTLNEIGLTARQISLVVGFKKEIIENFFQNKVSYVVQGELLGTAHAAYLGIKSLPSEIEQVLVLGGDDSAFYKSETLLNLVEEHLNNHCILTLLSAEVENPYQLGRIVRTEAKIEIIEKEYLTEEQKQINEISTGTFVFDRKWFEEIFIRMPKLRKLGEYGLPTALAMARDEGKKFQVIKLTDSNQWHGVNTLEELEIADKLKSNA